MKGSNALDAIIKRSNNYTFSFAVFLHPQVKQSKSNIKNNCCVDYDFFSQKLIVLSIKSLSVVIENDRCYLTSKFSFIKLSD